MITKYLDDDKLLIKIAKNGQETYKKLWSLEGRYAFCDHFINIITPR